MEAAEKVAVVEVSGETELEKERERESNVVVNNSSERVSEQVN